MALVDTYLMPGKLEAGAVVEIQVEKRVLVGVVASASLSELWIEMDGRLEAGVDIAVLDPANGSPVQGVVGSCLPRVAGSEGYRLQVMRSLHPLSQVAVC